MTNPDDRLLIIEAPGGRPTEWDMLSIKRMNEGEDVMLLNQETLKRHATLTENILTADVLDKLAQEQEGQERRTFEEVPEPPPLTNALWSPLKLSDPVPRGPYPFEVYKEYGGNSQPLRRKSTPVDISNREALIAAQNLIRKMWGLLKQYKGIGLAAPQVGSHMRVIVIDASAGKYTEPLFMINPEIVFNFGGETQMSKEACLSLPGTSGIVKRFKTVQVKFIDGNGEEDLAGFEGDLAVAVQHEIDHLNSVLYIDHLPRMVRDATMKKYRKAYGTF
jgi:peptide deformylase